METMKKWGACALSALILIPDTCSAHEVYVLSASEIKTALLTPRFSDTAIILHNFSQFVFWGFVTVLVIGGVFFISVIRGVENVFAPFFRAGRRYAAPVARVTVGLAFILSAFHGALYGPELPFSVVFGSWSGIATVLVYLISVLMVVGIHARATALAALGIFAAMAYREGFYALTYMNYLGETIMLLILGAHHGTHARKNASRADKAARACAPYSFAVLRICFGISLLYASLYAKIIHNNLALAVVYKYPALQQFFGFEPHFLVLGASIIEILIAIFFIFGIEIRFASLFLLFWLSLSLWYFGEAVWPHLILIGIPAALILYGYDRYSIEGRFFKHDAREPVL